MKKSGISLVALIITIIVLIILMSTVFFIANGENSIIHRAQIATENHNKSIALEKVITEIGIIKISASNNNQEIAQYMSENNEEITDKLLKRGIMFRIEDEEIIFEIDEKYTICTNLKGNIIGEISEEVDIRYVISFDSNGGEDSSLPAIIRTRPGETVEIDFNNIPTKEGGYTFKGWSTNSNTRIPEYTIESNQIQEVNENITLYAIWTMPTLYLYNNGTIANEAGDYTSIRVGTSYSTGTLTKNTANMYYYKNNSNAQWAYGGVLTTKKIDLTNYDTLTLTFNPSSYIVSSNSNSYPMVSKLYIGIASQEPSQNMTHPILTRHCLIETPEAVNSKLYLQSSYDVDITDITGSYYVGLYFPDGYWYGQEASLYITGIYLR